VEDTCSTSSLIEQEEQPAMEILWEDFLLETGNK